MRVHKNVLRAIESKGRLLLVLLDHCAFDTVAHSLLIDRLVAIGVRGTALK